MKRIKSLDALRGLAAITVVFTHIHGIFFTHHIFLDLTPLRLLWAGGESVILFFVLSGFVLSAPFCQDREVAYFQFIITRLTRIYLPMLASIGVALLLSYFFYDATTQHLHPFLENRWPHPITWQPLIGYVTLIGNFNTGAYNGVIWSLVHEMRFAIIFPVFIWMLNKFSWQSNLIFTGLLSIVAALAITYGIDPSQGFKNSGLYSLHYLLFFMAGGLLVKNSSLLGRRLKELKNSHVKILLLAGLSLFIYSNLVYSFATEMKWNYIAPFIDFMSDWGVGVASAIFIVLAIHNDKVATFLHNKLFLFLGKISFSLYLVHVPILAAALYIFANTPEIYSVAITFPFVFIAAYLFHKLIEAPSHQLGRRLFQTIHANPIIKQA